MVLGRNKFQFACDKTQVLDTFRGHTRLVSGKRSQGRVNVIGGLRYHDRKRLCYFIDKGNADSFFERLVKLNDFVFTEWGRAMYAKVERNLPCPLAQLSQSNRLLAQVVLSGWIE